MRNFFSKLKQALVGEPPEEDEKDNFTVIPADTRQAIDSLRYNSESMADRNEVLRYPPSETGFPANISGEYILLEMQEDMISAIKRELDIRDSEFDEMVMPMLVNFANFVQLFPASEHHHHRAQSGLLRHSLEVCCNSIRRAKNIEFDSMEVPEVKSNRILAWKLAIAAGGLLHDIGKPFTDFEIWDRTGEHHWPPGRTYVHEWAKKLDIDKYFLVWKSGRHLQHQSSTNAMMMLLIPPNLHEFLLREGNEIYNELNQAMSVSSTRFDSKDESTVPVMKNKILKIVKEADSASVLNDMRRYSGDAIRASQSGVPAVQRVVDAMRYLINKGTWEPNKPGNPIWVTTYGVFVVWGTAVKDITSVVKNSGGMIPQSANSLGDLMLSFHLCIPNSSKNEETIYWRLAPHSMNSKDYRDEKEPKVALSCIRLISPEILFVDTMLPNPISCRIRIETEWREFLSHGKKNIPVISESRPFVGQEHPSPTGIPPSVNPNILKGGTLIPDEDYSPAPSPTRNGEPLTEKNAHEHLRRLNLLSEADALKIKSRNEAANKTRAEQAARLPGESISKPQQIKPVQSNNGQVELQKIPVNAQGQLFADEPTSVSPDKPLFSLKEALLKNEIEAQYSSDEALLIDPLAPEIGLWELARAELMKTQNEVDSHDYNYQSEHVYETEQVEQPSNPTHIYDEVLQEQGHLFSPMYEQGSAQAKKLLNEYISTNCDSLWQENYHFRLSKDRGADDEYLDVMRNSGWLWQSFMEPETDYYLHRSVQCFYLSKELNYDIDYLSGGKFFNSFVVVDESDLEFDIDQLYRSIANTGSERTTNNGGPALALSQVAKRKIANELSLSLADIQHLILSNFDTVTKGSIDYIEIDDKIKNYMVSNYE